MTLHIALLRGINVGGNNMIAMAELRTALESAGFTDVKTLLQSGNVVLNSPKLKGAALEKSLEALVVNHFNLSIDFMASTAAEWKKIIAANPFPDAAKKDPGHYIVMFMKSAPKPADTERLRAAIKGTELVAADGKQLYITYPDGIGTSKLTNTLIEKHLGVRGTTRNWNTVMKLAAMVRG